MESSKPSLAAVLNELVPIEDKWQDIGIQLSLKDEILLEIERKPTNTRSQLREMIRHWLDTSKASWTDLVSALSTRLVSEQTIAGVLSSRYCYDPRNHKRTLDTDGRESRKDSLESMEREPRHNDSHRSEATTVVRVKGRNVPREVTSRLEKTIPNGCGVFEWDGTEDRLVNYEVDEDHPDKSHRHSISSTSELLRSEGGKDLRRKSLSDVKSARKQLNGHSEPVVVVDSRSKHTKESSRGPDLQDRTRGSYLEDTMETPNSRLKSRQTRVYDHKPRDYTKQPASSTDKRKRHFLPDKEKYTPRRPDKNMATISRINNLSSQDLFSRRSIDEKNVVGRSRKAPEHLKDAETQSKKPGSIVNLNGLAAAICDTVKTNLNEKKCDKQEILKVGSDTPKKRTCLDSIESPCETTTTTKPVKRFDEAVKSLMKSSSSKHSKSVERTGKVSDTESISEKSKKCSHSHSTHSERSRSSSHYPTVVPTKKTSDTKMKVKSKDGSDSETPSRHSKYKHSTKSPIERERKSRSTKVVKIEATSDMGSPHRNIKKSSRHHSSDSELTKSKSKHAKNKSESTERKRKSKEESDSETVAKRSKRSHSTNLKSPLENESDSLPSKMIKIEVSSDIEVLTRRKIKNKHSSDFDSTKKESEKHAVKKKKLEAKEEAEPESTAIKSRHSKTLPVSTKKTKLEVASDTDSLPRKSTKPHTLATTALPLSHTKRIKTEVLSDSENEYTPKKEVYRTSGFRAPVANVIKANTKVSNLEHNTDSVLVKTMTDLRTPHKRFNSAIVPAQTTTPQLRVPHFEQTRPPINSSPMTGLTAPVAPYVSVGRAASYYQPLFSISAKIPSLMDISFPSVSEATPYKHGRQQAAVPDVHPKPSSYISVPSLMDISTESSVGKATPGNYGRLGAPEPDTLQPTPSKIRKVASATKTKSSEKPPNSPKPNADEFNVPSTFGDGDCAKRQFIARKCVKCKRLPRKPKRSRCCLLLYCEPCSMDTKYQLCSVCGREQVFKLDSELNNKIPKLTVFCKHNSGGCDWKGKLYKLKYHLLHECEVPCPYSSFGCQATVTNDNYKSHIEKLALVHLELYKKSRNEPANS